MPKSTPPSQAFTAVQLPGSLRLELEETIDGWQDSLTIGENTTIKYGRLYVGKPRLAAHSLIRSIAELCGHSVLERLQKLRSALELMIEQRPIDELDRDIVVEWRGLVGRIKFVDDFVPLDFDQREALVRRLLDGISAAVELDYSGFRQLGR